MEAVKESWTDDRLDDLNDRVGELGRRMEARFAQVDARFDALDAKFDAKFDAMGTRFDTKLDAMNARFDAKFDAMHHSIIQFAGMMLAAVLGVIATQLALIITQL